MARRVISAGLLSVVALAMLAPRSASAGIACPGYENMMFCGDMNGDCKITSTDALTALRIGVGQQLTRPEADVDNSGVVTSTDALRLLRMGVGALAVNNSCAWQFTLAATASGFYNHNGAHTSNNYAVGWYTNSSTELRDYFVFDVSTLPGAVASAFLHLTTAPDGQSYYAGGEASETFRVSAVSTAINTLKGGTGGVSAFNDLGEGTEYGSFVAAPGLKRLVDIPLNASALQYLNNASSGVAFGGAIPTLTKGLKQEYLFNGTGLLSTRELVVQIDVQ